MFDLELPIDFKPENNDGEVDEFTLVKAADVRKIDILPLSSGKYHFQGLCNFLRIKNRT